MGNLQKYSSFSVEEANEAADELEKLGTGAGFMKLATGRNVVRIMPGRPGAKWAVLVHQHYVRPGGATKPIVFACPRVHAKQQCPSCDMADKLRDSGNPAQSERAYEFAPKLRVFCNAVSRKEPERGVLVLAFGKQVYEQLIAIRTNEVGGGDFTDPTPNGFDVVIEKKGEGKKTEYNVVPSRKESALGNDEWLDQMHDLSRYSRVMSREEIMAALGGAGGSAPRGRSAADDMDATDD